MHFQGMTFVIPWNFPKNAIRNGRPFPTIMFSFPTHFRDRLIHFEAACFFLLRGNAGYCIIRGVNKEVPDMELTIDGRRITAAPDKTLLALIRQSMRRSMSCSRKLIMMLTCRLHSLKEAMTILPTATISKPRHSWRMLTQPVKALGTTIWLLRANQTSPSPGRTYPTVRET